jgi:hypothetical protein
MPVDPIADSSSLRQPETKKGSKTQDKTGRKNEFENKAILNKMLGDKDKRAFLKKSPGKETSPQKSGMSINPAPTDRKGKYIDEMV